MDEVRRRRAEAEAGARRHRLDAGRGPLRGRLAAERGRPARRTPDPAHRRARPRPRSPGPSSGCCATRRRSRAPAREVRRAAATASYLDAVIKETLRLRPPVPGRRPPAAASRCGLGGHELPGRHDRRPLHPPDPPQRGDLPAGRAASVPERFLEQAARHLHLDPLRRRRPPLPRRQLRRTGDEAGAAHGALDGRPAPGRQPLGAGRAKARSPSAPTRGLVIGGIARHGAGGEQREIRSADRRRRRQGGRRSRPRSTSLNRLGLGPICRDDRREDRARRLLARAQRDDLGRGAAGGPADQGRRLPLPAATRQFGEVGRRDRRRRCCRSPGSATRSNAAQLRAPGSTPARRSVRHRDYGAYLRLGARAGDRGGHPRRRPGRRGLARPGPRAAGWSRCEERGRRARGTPAARLRPDRARHPPRLPARPAVASRVFHCDSRRSEFARLPAEHRPATSRRRRRRERAQLR